MTINDQQLDLDAIQTLDLLALMDDRAAATVSGHLAALVDEVRRLRAQLEQERENYRAYRIGAEGAKQILTDRLAKEERMHGETIDDRDRFHDMADKLAYAIAPEGVIGEHSSMNCPWENALDLITPKVEVDKLRQQLAAVTDLCDAAEKQATRWEHPLPVPEWVTEVRHAIDPTAPAARSAAV